MLNFKSPVKVIVSPFCFTEIDECATEPCFVNGTNGNCIDLIADYECPCKHGFSGKNCESSKYAMGVQIVIYSSFKIGRLLNTSLRRVSRKNK